MFLLVACLLEDEQSTSSIDHVKYRAAKTHHRLSSMIDRRDLSSGLDWNGRVLIRAVAVAGCPVLLSPLFQAHQILTPQQGRMPSSPYLFELRASWSDCPSLFRSRFVGWCL